MPADYLHTDNHDLLIQSGDFVVGESTTQHQDLLMLLNKGELRQYPKTGVGIQSFLNDDAIGGLYGEIQQQFRADGMTVNKLVIGSTGTVTIEAVYE